MVPSMSEMTTLSLWCQRKMWHLHLVVPWKAVVTLNSTSFIPGLRFISAICSLFNLKVFLKKYVLSSFSEVFSSLSCLDLCMSSDITFASVWEEKSTLSISTSFVSSPVVPEPLNQPNQVEDFFIWSLLFFTSSAVRLKFTSIPSFNIS